MAGIEWFDGAMSVAQGVGTADPQSGKTSAGGPIEHADGIDGQSSATVPTKTDNMLDMPVGSSSVIDSPLNA